MVRDIDGYSSGSSSEGGGTEGRAGWQDPRLMVPALASSAVLALTIATIAVCMKKREGDFTDPCKIPVETIIINSLNVYVSTISVHITPVCLRVRSVMSL